MRIDEQPRTRWPDPSAFRNRRPDLRLGSRRHRIDPAAATEGRIARAAHRTHRDRRVHPAAQRPRVARPPGRGRGAAGQRRRAARHRPHLRPQPAGEPGLPAAPGEISPESYPPLADLVDRCAAMRAATDGWFDAWAVPGGFDPGGLLGGWAVERAASDCAPPASTTTPYSPALTCRPGPRAARRALAGRGAPPDRARARAAGAGDDRRRGRHLRGDRAAGARGGPAHRRAGRSPRRRHRGGPRPGDRRRLRHRALRRRPHRPGVVPQLGLLARSSRTAADALGAPPAATGGRARRSAPTVSATTVGAGQRRVRVARTTEGCGPVGPDVDRATRRRAGASNSASDRSAYASESTQLDARVSTPDRRDRRLGDRG